MKKIFLYTVIFLICAIVGTYAFAARDLTTQTVLSPMELLEYLRDPILYNIDVDTITLANGATIDNAANNILEINENSDELKLTFGSNEVAISSTDVTDIDFGSLFLEMAEITAPGSPAANVGRVYVADSGGTTILYFKDAAGTATNLLAAGTGNTLNQSYDQGGAGVGRRIDATDGPVDVNSIDADAAFLLTITPVPASSAALGGVQISPGANSTQDALQIVNSGTGDDIQAGAGAFKVSKVAAVNLASATFSGATEITLTNGEAITNATDTEIKFAENAGSEDFSIDFISNEIDFKSSSGVVTVGWGDLDAFTGLNTLAFDSAASSISLAADGAADDLTVSVTGVQDSSLVLSSTGTGADALQITASAGGIDIAGNTGGDIDITSTGKSVNITATENVADSIVVSSSNGGVDIIAASAAAGEDIDLLATGSSVNITSTEAVADAIVLNASTAAGGIDITSNADIDMTTTGEAGEDITITNTGGSVNISGTEALEDCIVINANADGAGINISAQNDIDITMTNGAAGEDITISNAGGSVNISSTENAAAAVAISCNGGTSETITVTNTQGTGAAAIGLTSSAGGVTVQAVGATAGDVTLNAGDDIILTNVGQVTLDGVATQVIEIEGTANGFETRLQFTDATADVNYIFPTATAQNVAVMPSSLLTNAPEVANSVWGGTNQLIFEGSTADANEHIFAFTEPAATVNDPTYTFPGITGNVLLSTSAVRTSQQYVQSIAYAKLGSTGAGWVIGAADDVSLATLPQSQTGEKLIVPITVPLKVGWTITAFSLNGQLDSAGNTVTVDADLRKHTEATAGYADASIGAITQISQTADYKIVDSKGSLAEVVAADESYYVIITATTGATCDVEIAGITLTVSEL